MGKIKIITIDQNEKWNEIVKSFKNYDLYYLNEYVKANNINDEGEPLLIYFATETTKAINVVMRRDISQVEVFKDKIPNKKYYDLATPYGYGGFLIEGEKNEKIYKELNSDYINVCKKYNIISEFVRFNPIIQNADYLNTIYKIENLGRTVVVDLNSKEEIWSSFDSKNRNHIRKAIKSGVKVYCSRDLNMIDVFMDLYSKTMDKDNATDYYYFDKKYYEKLIENLKYNLLIFYAVYEGKIISISIMLFANNKMHYHLSGSDNEYKSLCATNLLLYEAACWGEENGYKYFHLGSGLNGKEDNLFKFKFAFNKNSDADFLIGKKIFDEKKYNELLEIRKEEKDFNENKMYFPEYRG